MSVGLTSPDPKFHTLVAAILPLVPPRQSVDIDAVIANLRDMLERQDYQSGEQVFRDLLWNKRQFERRHDHMVALAEWLYENVSSFDCLQDAAESLTERAREALQHEIEDAERRAGWDPNP